MSAAALLSSEAVRRREVAGFWLWSAADELERLVGSWPAEADPDLARPLVDLRAQLCAMAERLAAELRDLER